MNKNKYEILKQALIDVDSADFIDEDDSEIYLDSKREIIKLLDARLQFLQTELQTLPTELLEKELQRRNQILPAKKRFAITYNNSDYPLIKELREVKEFYTYEEAEKYAQDQVMIYGDKNEHNVPDFGDDWENRKAVQDYYDSLSYNITELNGEV